jgi:uncharacterized protein (DUF305 family)
MLRLYGFNDKEINMSVVSKGFFLPALIFNIVILIFSVSAFADAPGRGATADLERNYLRFIIDHHFSALRMTELAAGTETEITAEISPNDRVHPTPGFPETDAHAQADEIKSLARRNNRMQREEILTAQKFLKEWYGITHEPRIPGQARADIRQLQAAQGANFDRLFLQIFSRHHYTAVTSSSACLAGREVRHDDLRRYCQGIVDAQLNDIDEMRHLACARYGLCDLQPQQQHSHRLFQR